MAAVGTTHESGSVLGDRFALKALLGSGSSARVFVASDMRLQCPVAVKVLHESLAADARFVAQLRREARLAASLSHDHIVTILDSGEAGTDDLPIPYIVTEYMAGGSLAAILDGGVTLDASQTVALGLEAADALAYAHGEGLVHRDVKPSNLLFDTDGRLALGDFGIARAVAEASVTEPTDSGAGATRYASPEAVMGARAEPAGDVYSLGLVLLECLTGAVPLLGDTPVATMGRRIGESVEVPRRFGRLGDALAAATRRDTDERCTATELAAMLGAAIEELDDPTPLPLHPVVVHDDETAELTVDRSDGSVRILGVAPISSAAPSGADRSDTPQEEYIDLTAEHEHPGEPVDPVDPVDPAAPADASEFGRDAITVAEEHHALDSSKPGAHGVVEPLEVPPVPAPLASRGRRSAKGGSADGLTPVGRAPGRRGRRWVAMAVLLVLALGGAAAAGWWFLVRVPTHEVPDWIGGDIAEVTAAVELKGWELGPIRHDRVDGTQVGEVLAQEPEPGTELAEGEQVHVTISDGFTLTAVPGLAGLPEADALAQLEAAGLVPGERSAAHDEAVAPGSVISAAPAAGGEPPDDTGRVPRETVIDYVVSDGPAPRVVPDGIVGVPLSEAEAALAAVQLGVATSQQYSSSVDKGRVISSDAEPGSELPRDSVVSLVVSAGPEPIVVPDVAGQTGTAAAAALEEAGFSVSGIEGSPSGAVLATDPPAGESRLPGASVRVFTRSG